MKVDLGVEAGRKTLLLGQLVVVEVRVEIGNRLLRDIARVHAVVEDDTSSAIHVHSLVNHILRVHADTTDSLCVFGRGHFTVESVAC